MKKIISILLIGAITLSMVGCGNNSTKEIQTQTKEEVKQEAQQTKKDIPEMKLGEATLIETDQGTYNLTIDGLKTTEERNEYEDKEAANPVKQVVQLTYTYKNTDFVGRDGAQLYIDDYAFTIIDEEGNILRPYPVSTEQMPQNLQEGTKCTVDAFYGVLSDSKTFKVQFNRNDKAVREMLVSVE